MIADLIMAQAPDVVALQETRHDRRFDGGKGQGEQIAERAGYHATSAVAQVYVPVVHVDEGLTILTREPPLDSAVRRLTLHPHDRQDENHRVCLAATVARGDTRFHVFDTHFSLSAAARWTNALESAAFVSERSGAEPAILMGDLNAEPDEPAAQYLTGGPEFADNPQQFLDCWTAANPSDAGFTYSSSHPVRRIDYVLARNVAPDGMRSWLVGGEHEGDVYPSDHLGIVVEFPIS